MVKVFFDGSCYVCDGEVNHYKKYQAHAQIEWIDITHPQFDASKYGLNKTEVNQSLHTLDAQGRVQKGVDAFVVIWQCLPAPYPLFAKIIQLPIIYTCAKFAYACFAKIRIYLPKKNLSCTLNKKDSETNDAI